MGFKCSFCDLSFSKVDALLSHLTWCHAILSSGQEVSCGQEGCPRKFTCFKSLRQHLSRHTNEMVESDNSGPYCTASDTDVDMTDDAVGIGNDIQKCESPPQEEGAIFLYNVRMAVLAFVCVLASKPNMTMANVEYVIEQLHSLLDVVVRMITSRLKKMPVVDSALNSSVSQLVKDIAELPSSLDSVLTKYKFEKLLDEMGLYVRPQELMLGTREDRRHMTGSSGCANVFVEETMQYIPIGNLLSQLATRGSLQNHCSQSKLTKQTGMIADYVDTVSFKLNGICQNYPDAFRINLFVDAFETTNELGSHTGIHKLEALYMIVKNVSVNVLSRLENIFLVGLWYAQDVRKYGYERILRPVVDDLKRLASPEGLNVNGLTLHGTLVLFSADNLGAHSVFGFLESFNARKFCRFCDASKGDKKFLESEYMLRSQTSYDNCVSRLTDADYNPSLTGIKGGCILNEIPYFHVVSNYALDAMHDLLEGVIPFELQAILPELIRKKFLSEEELQKLVLNFNYGPSDVNSKPPFTFSHSIRVKAAEAWCLLRTLPLIVGSRIPRNDEHWRLLALLCEITDIIFAPRYSSGICSYLACIIDEHHKLFVQLFPSTSLLPKYHFLIHYPRCMLLSGPPSQYWCMRFEARHSFFKETARAVRCFRNICKTLAKRAQFSLAASLLQKRLFSESNDVGPCTEILVSSFPSFLCAALTSYGLSSMDAVYTCKWVSVGHYRFKVDCCAVTAIDEEYPVFGLVKAILYFADCYYLVVEEMQTLYYDKHFRSFAVHMRNTFACCKLNDLKDHHPSVIHKVLYCDTEHLFVQTRYTLM
jgi:hypothetical protein